MSVKQLSVFAENRNGTVYEVSKLLGEQAINIRAFSVAETASFGVLRLIVDDPRKAAAVLSNENKIVNVTDVVAASIPDRQGGLSELLGVLYQHDVSVEYLYAFVAGTAGKAYVVLRVSDNAAVENLLAESGFSILTDADLTK